MDPAYTKLKASLKEKFLFIYYTKKILKREKIKTAQGTQFGAVRKQGSAERPMRFKNFYQITDWILYNNIGKILLTKTQRVRLWAMALCTCPQEHTRPLPTPISHNMSSSPGSPLIASMGVLTSSAPDQHFTPLNPSVAN